MTRVLVVGGGPAGLAAAEALASREGVEVTLMAMGHILGGKACSWEREDGLTVEHGQHVLMGFYEELPALLRRSGADPEHTSVPGRGHFRIYEARDQRTHHLYLGECAPGTLFKGLTYTGFSLAEKAAFAAFFTSVAPRVMAGVPESLDDLCLTAWALQRGFPPSLVDTNAFRASREAQLNWPGEVSAYAMLQTLRVAGRDYTSSAAQFPAGGMSTIWWDRVADRIEALGGTIVRYHKLTRILHEGGRLTGLEFAMPLWHGHGKRYVEGRIPTLAGSEVVRRDFDAAILTLPPPALSEVLERDPVLPTLRGLSGVRHLTTIAPLGLHVWHEQRVTQGPHTVICGLEPPLGFVVDNKDKYPRYRDDPALGAALHFVGQETLFEEDDDETLLERALHTVRRIPGFEAMDRAGVLDWTVVRNRAPHKRYWNAEPGSLKHKPWPQTPIEGLWLAGDWVRGEYDFPCMETAVRSGRSAAEQVLRRARRAA